MQGQHVRALSDFGSFFDRVRNLPASYHHTTTPPLVPTRWGFMLFISQCGYESATVQAYQANDAKFTLKPSTCLNLVDHFRVCLFRVAVVLLDETTVVGASDTRHMEGSAIIWCTRVCK